MFAYNKLKPPRCALMRIIVVVMPVVMVEDWDILDFDPITDGSNLAPKKRVVKDGPDAGVSNWVWGWIFVNHKDTMNTRIC